MKHFRRRYILLTGKQEALNLRILQTLDMKSRRPRLEQIKIGKGYVVLRCSHRDYPELRASFADAKGKLVAVAASGSIKKLRRLVVNMQSGKELGNSTT